MKLPVFFDYELLEKGIQYYITIDLNDHSHILAVGATGSGKTYALSILLGKIAKYEPDVHLVICDYKKSGFAIYDALPGFYGYTNVFNGVAAVYKEFSARLAANDRYRNSHRQVLLVDEFSAFISALPKKESDETKRMVSEMLLMGRSLGINIIIGVQRADAEYFRAGTRDQFGAVLMLGNISKEQKLMLAPDFRDEMNAVNMRGQGYLLLDGKGVFHIQVPTVTNNDLLTQTIRQRLGIAPADPAGEA